jgi:hypothetical protein
VVSDQEVDIILVESKDSIILQYKRLCYMNLVFIQGYPVMGSLSYNRGRLEKLLFIILIIQYTST